MNALYCLISIVCGATREHDLDSCIHYGDTLYTVTYEFTTALPESAVVERIYGFAHLKKMATIPHLAIALLDSGNRWYDAGYTYNCFGYNSFTRYHKWLVPESLLVRFELKEFRQTPDIMARTISSNGHYQITVCPEGVLVRYFQKTRLNRPPGRMHLLRLKKETCSFLNKLKKYIQK